MEASGESLSERLISNECPSLNQASVGTHAQHGQLLHTRRNSSFLQATFNSVNLLLGIGILSSPFALQKGGWLGLGILFLCGVMFCYTAYTLGLCLSRNPELQTYQQIAQLAFGKRARVFISSLLYLELLGVLVGFTISLGDNLVKLFPAAGLELPWFKVSPHHLLPVIAVLIILPTVWMRDLSWLSYVSLGGVATYLVIVVAVTCAGLFDGLGFHHSVPALNLHNLATVTGLSAYCFSGHVVFPSIYTSIRDPSLYPKVLIVSFLIATSIYTGFGFIGATMFGDEIQSQVTLNLPSSLLVAKLSLWLVVLIPLTKYSIALNPIAVELESLLQAKLESCSRWHARCHSSFLLSIFIRTVLMAGIVALAFVFPYFDSMLAFVGSALSMTMCVVFPCGFYLKVFGPQLSKPETFLNYSFMLIAIVLGVTGSVDSVKKFHVNTSITWF